MFSKNRTKPDIFTHPRPEAFDYKALLRALRECRQHVTGLMSETGRCNAMYAEAEWLVAYIDTVARLTRVAGAMKFVRG